MCCSCCTVSCLLYLCMVALFTACTASSIDRNATGHLSDDLWGGSSANGTKTTVIRLVNAPARFGVVIDVSPRESSSGSHSPGYIDLKQNPVFDLIGSAITLDLHDSMLPDSSMPNLICIRHSAGGISENVNNEVNDLGVEKVNNDYEVSSCKRRSSVLGIRASSEQDSASADGVIQIPENTVVTFVLFGTDFTPGIEISFTTVPKVRGSKCDDLPIIKVVPLTADHLLSESVVKFQTSLPNIDNGGEYYFCLREPNQAVSQWIHQGSDPWLSIRCVGRILPIGLQALIICFLLILSGLFSGLNLGLMALECTELQVLEKCGDESEKKNARKIYPIRKMSNYLLCSLLLGNVLVNNTLTILLDDLTSGMIAIVLSTFGIVIFGEIIPQAICSRHGLAIGARTLWVTKLFMILTFPLSYPISKILDCVLGEEIRNVYNRKRLMEFIRVTKDYNDLQNEEVDIISGALELTKKTVTDVMTPITDVFMVPIDSVLDFETVSEITKRGYSRIPVYEGDRNNVVGLLNIKDLTFVDPDTNTPLRTLCEFYNHPVNFVFEDTTLDVMLNEFKKGRSHLAFVRCVNSDEDVDPFYELLGIVTLEDVIEEIIQCEIIDETDVLTDNRGKTIRRESQNKQDFSDFARFSGGGDSKKSIRISPQLALATYQYLSTAMEPFKHEYLSESVLKKLMSQDIFFRTKQGKEGVSTATPLFQNGKTVDYFILILEGRCLVTVGRENLVFETGPFSSFGLPAIMMNLSELNQSMFGSPNRSLPPSRTFTPDYTVIADGETLYMKVHYAVYLSAYRASAMERQCKADTESRGSRPGSSLNSRSSFEIHEDIAG